MLELVAKVIVAMCLFALVKGHGYMIDPPQRSSLWRDEYVKSEGLKAPVNYNDNELFCGGFSVQFEENNGKCGVCGDSYSAANPRDNEAGGKYANGIIARSYLNGSDVPVTINLTANHLGYFEFRLCPHNDVNTAVTQECLDQNVLEVNGAGTRYNISSKVGAFDFSVKLPPSITCNQCVLQWKYVTGNSWGCEGPNNTHCCTGCGNRQEHFINCADIEITSVTQTETSPTQSATMSVISSATTTAAPPTSSSTASTKTTSPSSIKTSTTSSSSTTTTKRTTPSTTTTATTPSTTGSSASTTAVPTTTPGEADCFKAIGSHAQVPGMQDWCERNCAEGFCPSTHCRPC